VDVPHPLTSSAKIPRSPNQLTRLIAFSLFNMTIFYHQSGDSTSQDWLARGFGESYYAAAAFWV
jgi:hypothetical protein